MRAKGETIEVTHQNHWARVGAALLSILADCGLLRLVALRALPFIPSASGDARMRWLAVELPMAGELGGCSAGTARLAPL